MVITAFLWCQPYTEGKPREGKLETHAGGASLVTECRSPAGRHQSPLRYLPLLPTVFSEPKASAFWRAAVPRLEAVDATPNFTQVHKWRG